MSVEIERKFLVRGDGWRIPSGEHCRQGYLNRDKLRTVRVRIADGGAWLTIKGPTEGAARLEFEYPIPVVDAEALLALCDGPILDKTRHRHVIDGVPWVVDEFHGPNAGLVVAEVELQRADQIFPRPAWAGAEVTGDPRYYNACLVERPFLAW